jgi:hypothetical protein
MMKKRAAALSRRRRLRLPVETPPSVMSNLTVRRVVASLVVNPEARRCAPLIQSMVVNATMVPVERCDFRRFW